MVIPPMPLMRMLQDLSSGFHFQIYEGEVYVVCDF